MPTLFLFILALLILGLALWLRQGTGVPQGRVVYEDTGAWGRPEKPLFSKTLQLTGKPDYLVQTKQGVVPVEVKSGNAPTDGPYETHIFQLAAYCALVAETYGQRPAYGLIKYADKTLAVNYTRQLETDLVELLGAMREDADTAEVERSHNAVARCRRCGFRSVCDESLV